MRLGLRFAFLSDYWGRTRDVVWSHSPPRSFTAHRPFAQRPTAQQFPPATFSRTLPVPSPHWTNRSALATVSSPKGRLGCYIHVPRLTLAGREERRLGVAVGGGGLTKGGQNAVGARRASA